MSWVRIPLPRPAARRQRSVWFVPQKIRHLYNLFFSSFKKAVQADCCFFYCLFSCFIYSLYLILSSFRKGRILQGYNLSRNKSLRLPKIIENEAGVLNSTDDLFATRQASALAADKKFPKRPLTEKKTIMTPSWREFWNCLKTQASWLWLPRRKNSALIRLR